MPQEGCFARVPHSTVLSKSGEKPALRPKTTVRLPCMNRVREAEITPGRCSAHRWYRFEIFGLSATAFQKHGLSREIVREIVPSTRCHPEGRCVTPHRSYRFALKCLISCFSASQGASSLEIRAGSWPPDAVHLSLKGRLSGFSRKCLSPWSSDTFESTALYVGDEGIRITFPRIAHLSNIPCSLVTLE